MAYQQTNFDVYDFDFRQYFETTPVITGIELNDGQESGYAGVNKLQLWQKIIDIEWKVLPPVIRIEFYEKTL